MALQQRIQRPVTRVASQLALLSGVWLVLNELFPSIAHARRGFPLFIIISDNPFLMIIGVILVLVWGYFRFVED